MTRQLEGMILPTSQNDGRIGKKLTEKNQICHNLVSSSKKVITFLTQVHDIFGYVKSCWVKKKLIN
jgi:hypothetical protein